MRQPPARSSVKTQLDREAPLPIQKLGGNPSRGALGSRHVPQIFLADTEIIDLRIALAVNGGLESEGLGKRSPDPADILALYPIVIGLTRYQGTVNKIGSPQESVIHWSEGTGRILSSVDIETGKGSCAPTLIARWLPGEGAVKEPRAARENRLYQRKLRCSSRRSRLDPDL